MNSCVAVIPARRAEQTIGRALESLRLGNGAFVSRVFVVTSLGDPTADVVRAWLRRDPRVNLVAGELPMTAGAARNLGLVHAFSSPDGSPSREALVLFLDADCELEAGGAQALAAELERRGAAALGARIARRGGLVSRVRHILEFKEAASHREPPAGWLPPSTTLLCRTDAFDRAGGFPDLWPGEDLVFAARLRALGAAALQSALVSSQHQHPGGAFEMLRHQHRLGRTAALARRMAPMKGEAFARSRALALLLLPARAMRIALWQLREGPRASLEALALSPLILAGLAAWTTGFVSASGTRPLPARQAAGAAWSPARAGQAA